MDTPQENNKESIINEIITSLEESKDQIKDKDTNKLGKIRDTIKTLILTDAETEEERKMRKRLTQKRYLEKNRDRVNERHRRARLGKKMECMVPENIIIQK